MPPDAIAQSPSSESIAECIAITGIDEPVILKYFETLNAGDFQAAGELFAPEGSLLPPFDQPIVGPAAIATYLQQEAKGFVLQPCEGTAQRLEDGCTEFQIVGKVQTPLFAVNVAWRFVLSPEREILLTKIKLLAALQELLSLRQASEN